METIELINLLGLGFYKLQTVKGADLYEKKVGDNCKLQVSNFNGVHRAFFASITIGDFDFYFSAKSENYELALRKLFNHVPLGLNSELDKIVTDYTNTYLLNR